MTKERRKREKVLLSADKQQEAESIAKKLEEKNPDLFKLPPSKRTAEELAQHFERIEEGSNRILPKEKRRYVIYLRKSTDDEAKQVRSLEDQRKECLELARMYGIKVKEEDIFEESKSAKKSGQRPIFDEILQGFRIGKYHGLLCWSPDRLSRNMKEAGEVIEMIDFELIQDLHFKTYQFDNTPNGKMLLGILFATSKQYSDKLSVDVKRGMDGNAKDGKYNGSVKKGYYVDASTGYFMPDGFNWALLREAVNMRLYQGKSNVEIAEFLTKSSFSQRKTQDDELSVLKVDKKTIGNIFEDPFYMGVYKYGNNIAMLNDLYAFAPLLTPDEYIALNRDTSEAFSKKYSGRSAASKSLDYGLLRGKVICDYCDKAMQFQSTPIPRGKNKGKHVLSFYCRNKECQRYQTEDNKAKGIKLKRSIRAFKVSSHIEWVLRHSTKKSKEAYQMHIEKVRVKLAQDIAITKRNLSVSREDLKNNQREYAKYQNFQVEDPDSYKRHHKGKLEHFEELIKVARHYIKENEDKLNKFKAGLPSEEEFYELTNSYLKTLLSSNDLIEQDAIYNELVSNLRVGNDSVSVIKLNPPYDLMVDLDKVSTGRG